MGLHRVSHVGGENPIWPHDPVKPVLPPPTRVSEVPLLHPRVKRRSQRTPLRHRAKELPRYCFDSLFNKSTFSLIINFLGIGLRSAKLAGQQIGESLTIVGFISFPVYLVQSMKNTYSRLKLMSMAARTGEVAETIFWLGRGAGSAGSVLSNVARPVREGLKFAGVMSEYAALGLTFSLIIPIVLIAFKSVKGIFQGWALLRTRKALEKFKEEAEKQDGSLAALIEMLEYLQGPKQLGLNNHTFKLKEKYFKDNHFTNNQRREAIQTRIQKMMNPEALKACHTLLERVDLQSSKEDKDLTLLEEVERLYEEVVSFSETPLALIDKTITLYDKLIDQIIDAQDPLYSELLEKKEALEAFRRTVLQEGNEIIETVRSEIHRQLCNHLAFILMTAIAITALALFMYPQYTNYAYGLVIATSSMDVIHILFDRFVSQESFYKIDRYLQNFLEKKSPPSVQ